jgi:hypothetical protein
MLRPSLRRYRLPWHPELLSLPASPAMRPARTSPPVREVLIKPVLRLVSRDSDPLPGSAGRSRACAMNAIMKHWMCSCRRELLGPNLDLEAAAPDDRPARYLFTSTGVVYGVDDPAVTVPPWLGVSA